MSRLTLFYTNQRTTMTPRIASADLPEGLIQSMLKVESYLRGTELSLNLLELVRVRVSQMNNCAHCIDMHVTRAMEAGEDAQRLHCLSAWEETSLYTKSERAVLRWAEWVTSAAPDIDGDTAFAELRSFFDQDQAANLTLAITQINGWNRLARSFGFPVGS
jgi:AhpD family alkylhydroperoxidase